MTVKLKKLFNLVAFIVFALIISVAICLQAIRWILPHLGGFEQRVEAYLANRFNINVEVERLSFEMSGFRTFLSVSNLSYIDENDVSVMFMNSGQFAMDLLASVYHRTIVIDRFVVSDLEVRLHQNEDGAWGMGSINQSSSLTARKMFDDNRMLKKDTSQNQRKYNRAMLNLDPSQLFLMARHVDIDSANIHFSFHNQRALNVSASEITVRNQEQFHRLNANITVDERQTLSLVLEGKGNPGNAKGFSATALLELDNFPLEKIASLFLPVVSTENQPTTQVRLADADVLNQKALAHGILLDSSLWFDFSSPSRFTFRGDLGLSLSQTQNQSSYSLFPLPFGADVYGEYSIEDGIFAQFQTIRLDHDFTLQPFSASLHDDRLRLKLLQLDLAEVKNWIKHKSRKDWFDSLGWVQSMVEALNPIGTLHDVEMQMDLNNPDNSVLAARLDNVSVEHWKKIPGLTHVNGKLVTNLDAGLLLFEADQLSVFPNELYHQPISLEQAQGKVAWKLDSELETVSIYGTELFTRGAYGQAAGYFELLTPFKPGTFDSELNLQVGINNSHSDYYRSLLPKPFPQSLQQWMDTAIINADIDRAGFIYRGGLKPQSERSLQFYSKIKQGQLYNEGWPVLNNIHGALIVDNQSLNARIDTAHFFEDVINGSVSWSQYPDNALTIQAQGSTPVNSLVDFVNTSPIALLTNQIFYDWSGTGSVDIATAITIPLVEPVMPSELSYRLGFDGNTLGMFYDITLSEFSGSLSYSTNQGFSSQDLQGKTFGKTQSMALSGGTVSDPDLRVDFNGKANAKGVADWLKNPSWFGIFEGHVSYHATLNLPRQNASLDTAITTQQQLEYPQLTIESNLQGLSSRLPSVLRKEASEKKELKIKVDIEPKMAKYVVHYDGRVKALVHQHNDDITSAVVKLSDQMLEETERLSSPKPSSIDIYGQFNELDLDLLLEELTYLSKYSDQNQQTLPISYFIQAKEAQLHTTTAKHFYLQGSNASGDWVSGTSSDLFQGSIVLPNDDNPITIELDELIIPDFKDEQSHSSVSDQLQTLMESNEFRPLDIEIHQLKYKSRQLGSWQLQVRKTQNALEFFDIQGAIAALRIGGLSDSQEGGLLYWTIADDGSMHTSFQGSIFGGDVASVSNVLNENPILKSRNTSIQIDLHWPGPPSAFQLNTVEGNIAFSFNDGLFIQNESTVSTDLLKLLGLLNFNEWARRIRLDFSDLYQKGFVFDELTGDISFDAGILKTNRPIQVLGPSVGLALQGEANNLEQVVTGELLATLPISGNISFATGLAAGLPAALGVYLIGKLFKDQIDKVSTIRYRVFGSLDEPKIEIMPLEKTKDIQNELVTPQSGS